MRWILLAVSALCLSLWVFFGNYPGPLGLPVPALGQFIYPATGFWHNANGHLVRPLTGDIDLEAALAKGSVAYDDRGVPHIFAPDLESAIFLQGFVTARDRLWQMDISTRSTGGRLAEVLGPKLIDRDTRQIRHGYRAAARLTEQTWKAKFPRDYHLAEVYADGVNAFIDQLDPNDYPLEFKLLDYAPEPWNVYKSALTTKGMSQSMTDRWSDAQATKALQELGREDFDELFPAINPKQTPIVPAGTPFNFNVAVPRIKEPANLANAGKDGFSGLEKSINSQESSTLLSTISPATLKSSKAIEDPYPFSYHPANGSNNWAVAGSKSTTGKPMLASDPHLNLTLPSIWYEIQIHTPQFNCRGVSLPGLPLIIIGFNDDIAWGMTNGGVDVTDWYRIKWADEARRTYLLDSTVNQVNFVTDTLRIKDSEPQTITTPWTVWGPVPETDTASIYYNLAKQQVALFTPTDRPGSELSAMLGAMQAKNYADFKAAMENYFDPIMNFALATRDGDISILSNGYFPIRNKEQGRFILDGSDSRNDWQGYVPYAHLPESKNPQRGYVASANQRQTDETYPYAYQGSYPDNRARTINRKLSQLKTVSQREMKDMQLNSFSIEAEELLPLLLARINRQQLDQEGKALFQLLAEWDYTFLADSRAAAYYEDWRKRVYELTTDELGAQNELPYLERWRMIALLRNAPNHLVFDIKETPARETAATITQRAFDEMLEEDKALPAWSDTRKTYIRHLGLVPGLGTDLLTTNGQSDTPNAIGNTNGPSWRMVVELGERPRAWGVLPGGPSGNPASVYYDAGVADWAKGRYYELARWADEAEAKRKATSWLTFH